MSGFASGVHHATSVALDAVQAFVLDPGAYLPTGTALIGLLLAAAFLGRACALRASDRVDGSRLFFAATRRDWAAFALVVGVIVAAGELMVARYRAGTLSDDRKWLPLMARKQSESIEAAAVLLGLATALVIGSQALVAARREGRSGRAFVMGMLALACVEGGILAVSSALAHFGQAVEHHLESCTPDLPPGEIVDARKLLALALAALGGTVVFGVAIWRVSRPREVIDAKGTSAHGAIPIAIAFLALAAGIELRSRPAVEELDTPLPDGYEWHGPKPHFKYTPLEGEGPDEAEPAMTLGAGGPYIYGGDFIMDTELRDVALGERHRYETNEPGKPFPGVVNLVVGPRSSTDRLLDALFAFRSAGYKRALLPFAREIHVDRPVLGPIVGQHVTAVRISLVPTPATVDLHVDSSMPVATLAREAVAARLAGHEVFIVDERPGKGGWIPVGSRDPATP